MQHSGLHAAVVHARINRREFCPSLPERLSMPPALLQHRTWRIVLAALLAPALLAGCGTKDDAAGAGGPPPTPTVTVAAPLVQPVVDWDEYVGRFEAVNQVDVRPRVSGQIDRVAFRDGQIVRRGDLLMQIDPRPFLATLAQAQADVARGRAAVALAGENFRRTQTLKQENALSQEEFDTSQAALNQARADLQAAQATAQARALDVSFARVIAPQAGRVSDRRLSAGNFVTAGQTVLTTIVSVDPIHFVFTGSEGVYLKYQRQNQAGTRTSSRAASNPVEIRLQDENRYRWRGRMNFVDNALDAGSGTIRGRAVVANADGFLTPGLFGHMRLLGSGVYDGMMVPEAALVTDQTRRVLLLVGADGRVVAKPVEIGPLVEGLRVVRSGIARSDRLIIAGVGQVRPGMLVKTRQGRIVPPAPGTGPDLSALAAPPPSSEATPAAALRTPAAR
jgi:RND family efflux transporter MFP subunit